MSNLHRRLARVLSIVLCAVIPGCGRSRRAPIDPLGFTGKTGGCGDFFVYRFDAEAIDAVTVRWRGGAPELTAQPRAISLPDPRLEVFVERWSAPAAYHYCNDVVDPSGPEVIRRWRAVSGKVLLAAGMPVEPRPGHAPVYHVVVTLDQVELRADDGDAVRIDSLEFGEVLVGWLPG